MDTNNNNAFPIITNHNNVDKHVSDKIVSYGDFLVKNKNATKKERCNAIYNFYKKLLN